MSSWRKLVIILTVSGTIILPVEAASAAPEIYTYDVYGRVVSVTYSNGYTVTYTYDSAGNRIATVKTP